MNSRLNSVLVSIEEEQMAKKKKEVPIVLDEPVKDLRSSVISFGDVTIEMHYDRKSDLLYGIVTDNGKVKTFKAEVN